MLVVTLKMLTLLSMSLSMLEIGTKLLDYGICHKRGALKHLLPVLGNSLSLNEIFVCSLPGEAEEKGNFSSPEIRQMLSGFLKVVDEKHPGER